MRRFPLHIYTCPIMKLFDQLENIDQDIVTHFNSHKEVVNKVLPHVIGL